jgi:hypothetical protein
LVELTNVDEGRSRLKRFILIEAHLVN